MAAGTANSVAVGECGLTAPADSARTHEAVVPLVFRHDLGARGRPGCRADPGSEPVGRLVADQRRPAGAAGPSAAGHALWRPLSCARAAAGAERAAKRLDR